MNVFVRRSSSQPHATETFPRIVRKNGLTCSLELDDKDWVTEVCRDAKGHPAGFQRHPREESSSVPSEQEQPHEAAPPPPPAPTEWRRNAIEVGAAVSVAFLPDPVGATAAYGFSLTFEHALVEAVSFSLSAAVSPIPNSAAFALGIGIPIYVTGRAPSGLAIVPSFALTVTPIVVPGLGLSLGYRYISSEGFVLGIFAGPSVAFVGSAVFGLGASVSLGYAF